MQHITIFRYERHTLRTYLNDFVDNNKPAVGEVPLFRELAKYFKKKYCGAIHIIETHQKYYVEFNSKCGRVTKEISDLWIIVYSPEQKQIRMTFLQAKYKNHKETYNNNQDFKFEAEYFQYELLSQRRIFTSKGTNNVLPDDILANAQSDSIGSYGVFYHDDAGKMNFAFSIASFLQEIKTFVCYDPKKSIELQFNRTDNWIEKVPNNRNLSNSNVLELINTLDVDFFERCILNLLVGSPVESDKVVLRFTGRFLNKIKNDVENKERIEEFIELIRRLDVTLGNDDVSDEFNVNTVLINVDTVKRKNDDDLLAVISL